MMIRGIVVVTHNGLVQEFPKVNMWTVSEDKTLSLYDETSSVVVMYNSDSWTRVGYTDVKPHNS